MNIVMLLIPLMLMLVALGILLFSWAVKSGQYDDLDGPAHRILHDDDKDMIPTEARPSKPSSKDNQTESEPDKTTKRPD
ncbi:MAG: cbb3-type cytochrome oxidase assembly protein CcoS [Gammaproteobacteria bacterium]|uniref:Cytochrome oxidase maturation protein cbb3-type n=1 Tax=Marinobacter litoralis TaxID=187981 RepID=A0A3M2RL75_9GAMM|nr:cbb3-type cytochrome oxidase assembly protein CcoS [Marinobacter litoralis]MBR9870151.1 cbb3-type cytochrome oxidase assembly protein CcoS [Gammaproteobacteria bacterium]RMJ06008.1 Cytochrome oxidase maturation protein cbb3-type [Marinobacter litoralis]